MTRTHGLMSNTVFSYYTICSCKQKNKHTVIRGRTQMWPVWKMHYRILFQYRNRLKDQPQIKFAQNVLPDKHKCWARLKKMTLRACKNMFLQIQRVLNILSTEEYNQSKYLKVSKVKHWNKSKIKDSLQLIAELSKPIKWELNHDCFNLNTDIMN